nr:efflux pump patc [Quercus suber]
MSDVLYARWLRHGPVSLYALDNTIVATIQPAIIEDLGHIEKLPWLSVTYQLGSFALDLTRGKLFAQFNGKLLFVASVVIFEVGSALCGAAPTIDALIIGRVICGAGGVGIYMGALNLLGVSTTQKERPIYISCMGIIWGSGTVLGPVIGGAFADSSATWRWAFYINLIIGAVAAPAYLLLPATNADRHDETVLARVRTIDWVGTVLICGASVSGFMAVNFGGALFEWRSGTIIGCFVCSGVLWIMFGLQQSYAIFTTQENRLFPCDMVLNLDAVILFAQTAAGMGTTFVAIYFIPVCHSPHLSDLIADFVPALLPIRPKRVRARWRASFAAHDFLDDFWQYPERHDAEQIRPFQTVGTCGGSSGGHRRRAHVFACQC